MARGLHINMSYIPEVHLHFFSLFTNRIIHDKYLLCQSVGMAGGFLPDIDIPLFRIKQEDKYNKVKKESKKPDDTSWHWAKHRGITHTFLFITLISAIILYFHFNLGLIFLLGAISHILLDSLNKTPMKPFYPASKIDVCFYKMTVDSFSSRVLVLIPLVALFVAISYSIFKMQLWITIITYLAVVSIITILARNIYILMLFILIAAIFIWYFHL